MNGFYELQQETGGWHIETGHLEKDLLRGLCKKVQAGISHGNAPWCISLSGEGGRL